MDNNLQEMIDDAKTIFENDLSKLENQLKSHDWYYDYSDDYSVWNKGKDKETEIRSLISQLKKEGKRTEVEKIWQKYAPKGFSLPLTGEPKPKKPEYDFKSGSIKQKGKDLYLDLSNGKWTTLKDFRTTSKEDGVDYWVMGIKGRHNTSALKKYIKKYELKPDTFEIVDVEKIKIKK